MRLVTVIVPNYNHARFLPRRIDSILSQTFQDFELILLDDCSTDESRSILSKYAYDSRVRIELNEVNSGTPFKQWNKGVRMARGKYVWIAESDDYADAHFLECLVGMLGRDPAASFGYCRSWRVTDSSDVDGFVWPYLQDEELTRWASDFVADGSEECRRYFFRTNIVPNASAVLLRKEVYAGVGGADESLRLCGDWKLWAAMALRGKVAYLSEPLNYYRFHDASVRSKTTEGSVDFCERLSVVRWISGELGLPAPEQVQRDLANGWVPLLMSLRIPLETKREILRDVRAIDPSPLRHAAYPVFATVQRKFKRHWRWLRSFVGRAEASKA